MVVLSKKLGGLSRWLQQCPAWLRHLRDGCPVDRVKPYESFYGSVEFACLDCGRGFSRRARVNAERGHRL